MSIGRVPDLGRLEQVDLRSVWESEPYSFTPWLALEANLDELARVLEIPPLLLVQTEAQVSEFSVDIVAKIEGTDDVVVIENQLERTDHSHLGQALTYASGTEAKLIIWIAQRFADGHRAAIDWLNRMTSDEVGFFGVEIEAWRIGDSAPAPRFNVVAKPNDWARAVREVSSAPGPDAAKNIEFWDAFHRLAEEKGLREHPGKAGRGNNIFIPLFKEGGITIANCAFISRSGTPSVGAYLYLQASAESDLVQWLEKLERVKFEIEKHVGVSVEVRRRTERLAWVILYKTADPDSGADRLEVQSWLVQQMMRLDVAFREVVAPALNISHEAVD